MRTLFMSLFENVLRCVTSFSPNSQDRHDDTLLGLFQWGHQNMWRSVSKALNPFTYSWIQNVTSGTFNFTVRFISADSVTPWFALLRRRKAKWQIRECQTARTVIVPLWRMVEQIDSPPAPACVPNILPDLVCDRNMSRNLVPGGKWILPWTTCLF